jgi:signal transduction histidine kinase
VSRVVELYKDVADAQEVELQSGGSLPTDLKVDGDRTRLEQVAANLVDNAVKYTPAGGRVEISIGREANRGFFRVADTGPGIPSDELPRIWDRLFRGDASRAERGLGLGLSLVKAIVEAHGGTVSVDSQPGAGATFTVWLPILSPM